MARSATRLARTYLIALAALAVTTPSVASAKPVTIAWDPNPPEEEVVGYVLYYGTTSRHDPRFNGYEAEVDVGQTVQHTVEVPFPHRDYYFSVVAYNSRGLRSDHSLEVMAPGTTRNHSIEAHALGGGRVMPSGTMTLPEGESVEFTVAPDPGHHVSQVEVDGTPVGAVTSYMFTDVSSSHTLSASFAPDGFSVTAGATEGGTVDPSGSIPATFGEAVTVHVRADPGHHVADVFVDGHSVGAVESYTFSGLERDHTLTAEFAVNLHTVTAAAGPHGSMEPDGQTRLPHGAGYTFRVTPEPGHRVSDVQIDGVSMGPVESHSFDAVVSDHMIKADFVPMQFTVSIDCGPGGACTPDGRVEAMYGDSLEVTALPEAGYRVAGVRVDDVSMGPRIPYTIPEIHRDHAVEVRFVPRTHRVVVTSGPGGEMEPDGEVEVAHGHHIHLTATPDPGHRLVDLRVDAVSVGAAGSYTLGPVAGPHRVLAEFEPIHPTVSLRAEGPGTITPDGEVSVGFGEELAVTATPDEGCKIVEFVVDGIAFGAAPTLTLASVERDRQVLARFAPEEHVITARAGPGGAIRPEGSVTVPHGASREFAVVADRDYQVSLVLVDGARQSMTTGTYSFVDVRADHRIQATFEPTDVDADGLPDPWERKHFGDLAEDGSGDRDGDGRDDAAEFLHGTDPTAPDGDPLLAPVVLAPLDGGTVVDFRPELSVFNPVHDGSEGSSYLFQVATDREMSHVVCFGEASEGISVTAWKVTEELRDQTRYFWRVRRITGPAAGTWSPVYTFYLDTRAETTSMELEAAEYALANSGCTVEVTDETMVSHGAAVDVSGGTLPHDVLLTVGVVENPPPPQANQAFLGPVYEFGPHGVPLGGEASLFLPFSTEMLEAIGATDPWELSILRYDTQNLRWQTVPVEAVDDWGSRRSRLLCRVDHFSMYAVGWADPEVDQSPFERTLEGLSDGELVPSNTSPTSSGDRNPSGGGCFLEILR